MRAATGWTIRPATHSAPGWEGSAAASLPAPAPAPADGLGTTATAVGEGVAVAAPISASSVGPLSRTSASSTPAIAARPPPTPPNITAGRRHHGTALNPRRSTPARTLAPRSRGGAMCRRPETIRRWSANAASVARQAAHVSRCASSLSRSASVRSPVSDPLMSSSNGSCRFIVIARILRRRAPGASRRERGTGACERRRTRAPSPRRSAGHSCPRGR